HMLRTCFTEDRGRPSQVVVPAPAVPLPVVDLRLLPEPESEALALAEAEARRPFDLAAGPLLRTALLRLGEEEYVLVLVVHHIASDGWSTGVMIRELAALYLAAASGAPSPLPALRLQYADFARWQRETLASGLLEAQLAYWRRQLAGMPEVLDLPTDRPRTAARSRRGGRVAVALPAGAAPGLRRLGRRSGATLFMTLHAGFQALLARYTQGDEAPAGSPVAGRTRVDTEELIGFFVNTLVLRTSLAGDPSFAELLHRTRDVTLSAYDHQDVPFERLVEELAPRRDLRYSPLFQVMLAFQNTPATALAVPGLRLEPLLVETGVAKFDLLLSAKEEGDGLEVALDYDRDLFDAATAERIAGHLGLLLAGAVAEPGRPLSDLPLLGEEERAQLLVEWNATAEPRETPGVLLHELFAARASLAPEAVALVWGDERISYGELESWAERLACRLRGLGVGPEVRVALLAQRTPALVAGLLGILKAGGVYVPLDPAYPRQRLALVLEDSAAALVLAGPGLELLLPAASGIPTVSLAAELPANVVTVPAAAEDPGDPLRARRLAYLIYTSGSTGRPKGVAIEHRSAVERMRWARQAFSSEELAGVLAATSVCFDLSVFELFAPLSWGGTAILAENALALPDLPARGEVTLVNTVPSVMGELLRLGAVPASVRTVNLAGEALRRALVVRIRELGTVGRVLNLYGPSEDTTYSTMLEVEDGAEPSIGRALPNTRAYVLDRGLRPLPMGVPGELCLWGAGLARGYLGRPGLTAERFVPDPFGGVPGARLYRTGDLARWSPARPGEIEFLGRADHQVKVHGFRIEPGEVEAVLAGHPAVAASAVVARELSPGDLRLAAYVTLRRSHTLATFPGELREHLRSRLPEHMVPSVWMELEALPLTPNGKVDRRALPAPALPARAGASTAPRDPQEEILAGLFGQVLGIDGLGVFDSFFELGGHSLLATQLISKVRQVFGREVPLRALFENPTVAGLAAVVAASSRVASPPLLPLPRPDLAAGEAALPLSFAQERLWFLEQLEPGSAFYSMPSALRIEGRLSGPVLEAVLREIVQRHESLRTTFGNRDGRPFQRFAPRLGFSLPMVDLSALAAVEERTLAALATEDARRPFDLERGPLVRSSLLRLAPERHVLLFNLHHIISDGWSSVVLMREVVALYAAFAAGRPSPLAPLPIQYADYAVWQRGWLQGEVLAGELAYWRRQLAGIAGLDLPLDRPRPPVETFRGSRHVIELDGELTADLHTLSRGQGATLFMALLAGFQALLSRLTGQVDVPVGSPIANRSRAEVEGLIGFFANTLVLRTDLGGNPGFDGLLRRVREVALEAYAHQELPFEKLVVEVQPERDMSRNPLFQVMCVLQNQPQATAEVEGLAMSPLHVDSATAKFDLTLFWHESQGRLHGLAEYNTDLFDAATARRIVRHYEAMLRAAAAAPHVPLLALPLLSPAERHQA
ncbi:MAG TPA: amino acid adenylation domain-containing protein, partial [Thermoanaerobaculia bacterium]|nr:amino acid adenylation domain-containing protein [Thermoanaerobaculia bacterium]